VQFDKSIGKMHKFRIFCEGIFVQNAEQKIVHHNVNLIHGSPRPAAIRQNIQKFLTMLKIFVHNAKLIDRLHKNFQFFKKFLCNLTNQ
jgi:hypothetical protein